MYCGHSAFADSNYDCITFGSILTQQGGQMNRGLKSSLILATVLGAISSAHAITFFNINIVGNSALVGTVGVDSFFHLGANGKDIDFTFNKAVVGDNRALRSGVINITYEAKSDKDMYLDNVTLTGLTLLTGSGHVRFTEIVEDKVNVGVIGTLSEDFYAPTGGFSKNIAFSRNSSHIKVKKTIYLDAFDTRDLDLAGIGLVEQKIACVPEPGTFLALGAGVALVALKRRGAKRA